MIDKLPEPFQTAIKTSKLWKDETKRGGLSVTNSLCLYLPERINEDAFLVIRMGYVEGFKVSHLLGLGDPKCEEGRNCGRTTHQQGYSSSQTSPLPS